MKVLVVNSYIKNWLAGQKEDLPDNVEIISPEKGTEEELIELAKDVEIIVCTRLSAVVVENAKKLILQIVSSALGKKETLTEKDLEKEAAQ